MLLLVLFTPSHSIAIQG